MMAQQRGRTIDVETYGRVERASNHIAELLHELCNEPSLGLYFVQDNIRASVPRYVDIRVSAPFLKLKKKTLSQQQAD